MKKLFAFTLLQLGTAMLAASGTFHGQWIVRDAGSNAVRFASFTIQPIAAYGTSTSNTITGDRKTFRTDSDGRVTVSNLFNGRSYRVQITGANFTTTFTNSFDTNVSGLVNGADYLSAPIRDAGLVAYSQAQSDSRFLRTNISHLVRPGDNITITTNGTGPSQYLTISSTASGGGSATNVNFYPGQSTTWRTLGGSNVVDVTGTLTNSTTGNAATATLATNAIKLTGPLTNGMNYGSSFRSTGAGAFSDQFGYNAGADGEYALAVGYGADAAGDGALAIGPDTIASQPNAIALGNGATATGNASVAIGAGVTADTANTIKLGTATHAVITEGTNVAALFVGDGVGVTNLSGTNIASGTIAPARLGSGSGGATKFLREDSTWQTVSGGGSTEYFYPGQSTTWRTVGGSNVVDVVGTLTNLVSFSDADNLWTATTLGAALEEMNDSINAGVPNGAGAKVHWSQLLGVPAGFSDGTDDGAGGGSPGGSSTYVQYNNAGSFAGEDAFAYTAASDTLTLSNLALSGTMTVSGSLNLNTLNVTNSIWYGAATLTNADNAIAAASITNGAATASSIAGYDANKKLTSITDLPSTTTTPTASAGDNDTSVATTAFTTTAVANATNLTNLRVILNSSSNNWNGSFTGNGTGLTNLTLNLQTNANNAGVLACGKTTFTNITGNITIAGFSGVDLNFNQFAKLWITNSTATSYSVTVPASVSTSTNTFVLGKAFWVTNGSALTINFDLSAWGTNAAAVRWTP